MNKKTEVRENKEPRLNALYRPPVVAYFVPRPGLCHECSTRGINKVVSKACPDTHTPAFTAFVISKAYSLGEGFAV